MKKTLPFAALRAPVAAAALAAAACAGPRSSAPPPERPPARHLTLQRLPAASRESARREASAPSDAPARSHLLGNVDRRALGPFLARTADAGLAVWMVPSPRGAGSDVVAVPLGPDGAPLADPRVLASPPSEATSLVVRPIGRGRGGWWVAWSGLLDRGEGVGLLEVARDATPVGTIVDVQRTGDHVVWLDVLPTAAGALCVWAEETMAGDANVLTATVDASGKLHDRPLRAARGVVGWAAARAGAGGALALVTTAGASDAGSLSWLRLDAGGRPVGLPVAVGGAPTVSGDVDLVSSGTDSVLAWTDRTGEDPQVTLAVVGDDGRVRGPLHAVEALGGSSLVGLASGPAGVAIAWEEPHAGAHTTRSVQMGAVSTDAPAVRPAASVLIEGARAPELVATDDGFALLGAARACSKGASSPEVCRDAPVPTFVRFDARLAPTQTEPIFVGDSPAAATLSWGLGCAAGACVALAAAGGTPTPVFSVDLSARVSPFAPPLTPEPPPGSPRVVRLVTLASGRPFTDLSAARAGDATLVATLADAEPPASGADATARRSGSVIAVRAYDDAGRPLGAPTVLTSRALAVGRVAVASAGDGPSGAAVAWVALDGGDPQVHLARVDARGKLLREAQVTTAAGDASSVALAWAGDGWLVAWVDGRDGNGEVYAAKVGRDLDAIGPGRRITRAPGDAADVALAVRGDTAWLAWSDPRESPAEGLGDIYATTLGARDASPRGPEVRVLATAAHSRSPSLVATAEGAWLAWIEDSPMGVDAPGAAMIARLDARGRVAGDAEPIQLAGDGRPTSVAWIASPSGPRALITRARHGATMLDAATPDAGGAAAARPWRLVDLDAPAAFDVVLATAGGALFYDDAGSRPDDHRIRRATIEWKP